MRTAILDTCFLEKFNRDGQIDESFQRLMKDAGFDLIIHPYVYKHELSMFSYVDKLISDGVFRVADYNDFITDDVFKVYYSKLYINVYNEFYEIEKIENPNKAENMHVLNDDVDVFEERYAKSSMGDVHMIMMAVFMDIPIILSEDNDDLFNIYKIVKRRKDSENFKLELYTVIDLIDQVKKSNDKTLTNKELKHIKNAFGKKRIQFS